MKTIFKTAVVSLLLLPFICSQKKVVDNVEAIELYRDWPVNMALRNGVWENINNQSFEVIYTYKDYVLYKLDCVQGGDNASMGDMSTWKPIPGTEPHFIYRKNEHIGKYFKTFSATPTILSADSIKKEYQIMETNRLDSIHDMLVAHTITTDDTKILQYYFPVKKSAITPDSIYFCFDKTQNDVDYSLNKGTDSMVGMKLCKVIVMFNPAPKRAFLFEFKRGKIDNQDSMKNVFQHFINKKL